MSAVNASNLINRVCASGVSALGGALIGVLLAAFGNGVSSTTTGIVATLMVAGAIGCYSNRLPGLLFGVLAGAFVVFCGSLVGGSPPGVLASIAACAFIAGYCRWVCEPNPAQSDKRGAAGGKERLAEKFPQGRDGNGSDLVLKCANWDTAPVAAHHNRLTSLDLATFAR